MTPKTSKLMLLNMMVITRAILPPHHTYHPLPDNYEKTDTTLLLKGPVEDLKFMAFGKEAAQKLAHPLVHDDPLVYGFNHFKMALYGKDTKKLVSHNGVEVPALDVISHSLKVLSILIAAKEDNIKKKLLKIEALSS